MSQFDVIDNDNLPGAVAATPIRPIEAGDADTLVTDRPWHVTGENYADASALVRPGYSGVFLTGKTAEAHARAMRPKYPTTPMIVEPLALTGYHANEDAPFADTDPAGLFDTHLPLEAMLDRQRLAGQPIAFTPTGQIDAGDSETLKAVVEAANDLDRNDVLVAVPLRANWMSEKTATDQVIKVLSRSKHPIALTLVDGNSPLGSVKRMKAHRRVITETTAKILAYRIDLNGLDAIALGAASAAIGAYPTKRRLDPWDKPGGGPKDRDTLSPQMLMPDMLRIVRSTEMRKTWFTNAAPIICFCAACGGAPIDRLHESDLERAIGHRHNVLGLELLLGTLLTVPAAQRPAIWAKLIDGALDTYPQLEAHLGRAMHIPKDIGVWGSPVI